MSISPGVDYVIQSLYYPGAYLQLSSTGYATLDVSGIVSTQLWEFQSSGGSAAIIMNRHSGTFIAGVPSTAAVPLLSSSSPQAWYLTSFSGGSFVACYDPTCLYVWAPYVDSQVYLVPSASITDPGVAAWSMEPVSSGPPPAVGSSDLPSPSTAAPTTTFRPTRNSDVQALEALSECSPCGKAKCTFTSSGNGSPSSFSVLVGQPVSNCDPGSSKDTKTTVTGTVEVGHTFGTETSGGLQLGAVGLEIKTTVKKETTDKIIKTQSVEVTVSPGQVGAVVANVSYIKTPGEMKIDDRALAFVSVDPKSVAGFSVIYADCGSELSALIIPQSQCSSSSSSNSKASVLSALLLLGISVLPFFL